MLPGGIVADRPFQSKINAVPFGASPLARTVTLASHLPRAGSLAVMAMSTILCDLVTQLCLTKLWPGAKALGSSGQL